MDLTIGRNRAGMQAPVADRTRRTNDPDAIVGDHTRRTNDPDVIVGDHVIWTRQDAEFFAAVKGRRVEFPPQLVPIQQGILARARYEAAQRGDGFDPVTWLRGMSRSQPDLFDPRLVAQAADFYNGGRTSSAWVDERRPDYYA